MADHQEIVGLVPAGGHATRLSPLPGSKELFPIGFFRDKDGGLRPKAVSHYLLDKYKAAGIRKSYIVLRKGKWDIPQYFGEGSMIGMDLAYLIMNLPHGHPFTLDQAFPFTRQNRVAFGFPDILFSPEDAFAQLARKQEERSAAVVLGIFPIRPDDSKWDFVSFDSAGKPLKVTLSIPPDERRLAWGIALWTPEFSLFMHDFLARSVRDSQFIGRDGKEYVMSDIFQAALDDGMAFDSVILSDESPRDIGTPEDLLAAQQEYLATHRIPPP
jgi:glucose-1-phosphate thymidylyltransferase